MIKTPLKTAKTGLADEAQAWLKLSTPGAGPEPVGRPAACPGGLLYPLPAEAGARGTGRNCPETAARRTKNSQNFAAGVDMAPPCEI